MNRQLLTGLVATAFCTLLGGAVCQPEPSGGGANGPASGAASVDVSPDDQDITDQDYAYLFASTANLPEAAVDLDGIHAAPMLRWTITSGGGGLNRTDPSSSTVLDNATTLDTDPSTESGGTVLYFPDLGSTGDVVVKVDMIRPTDRTVINEFGDAMLQHENVVVVSDEAVIHINDLLRLRLTPPVTKLPAAGVVSLQAIFEAAMSDGDVPDVGVGGEAETGTEDDEPFEPADITYEWNMTGLAGAGDLQSQSDSDTAVFTAGAEAATFTITVKTTETAADGSMLVNGPAKAVVQVDPNLRTVNTFGYYLAKDEATIENTYSVTAWVYVPKVEGALSYSVVGQGMHDPSVYGDHWSWAFAAVDGTISGLEESGGAYRFGLSGAGGSPASFSGEALAFMDARFSGMRVIVTVVVPD